MNSTSLIISLVAIVIGSMIVIIAYFIWRTFKHARYTQIYLGLLNEFKSASMLTAIEDLYAFKRFCDNDDKDYSTTYEDRRKDLQKTLDKPNCNNKIALVENSLHHNRRLVSNFYHFIYIAITRKRIKEKYIFEYWSEGAISIIPEIIDKIGRDPDKGLMDLYNMSKRYAKKRKE